MAWNLARIAPPWDPSRPSIYDFIASRLDENGSLGQPVPSLPDEEPDPSAVSFGAGTLDGISRHWGVATEDDAAVSVIVGAVAKLARRATPRTAARLYELVADTPTLGFVDKALPFIASSGADPARVQAIGHWLATRAPDRSAVKFGIALLGLFDPPDIPTLITVGAHDEFTLYSAVSLSNTRNEAALFELAKRVDGWGRIECVERLANTADPHIKRWMLLDGFRNSIMDEYLALTCARTGGLAEALAAASPDDQLVDSAGDLLQALLSGEPGPPPNEYSALVPALRRYVELVGQRPGNLRERSVVRRIRDLIDAPGDVPLDSGDYAALAAAADDFLARPHFRQAVDAGLIDADHAIYWDAKNAARDLGIDIYDAVYSRIETGMDDYPLWFDLLQATDEARIDRSLELGRELLDLSALASGPSNDIGLGPTYAADDALGSFLQELRRFPGKGQDLVAAGLRNRVVRNRNLAIRALQDLPRGDWPDGAAAALEAMIDAEVSDDVRTFAQDVLRGEVPVAEAWRRTVATLRERNPELAELAEALANTRPGRQLRAQPGFGDLRVWDGTYDTSPADRRHVTVYGTAAGFGAHLSDEPATAPAPSEWSRDDAVAQVAALLNRLLVE